MSFTFTHRRDGNVFSASIGEDILGAVDVIGSLPPPSWCSGGVRRPSTSWRTNTRQWVSEMDDGIGAVLKALDESGLKKKTIVAFLSDNGGALQANASTNGPLRSGKGSMYEGALRVPFLVSWPGTLPAGKIADRPVVALDLPVTARHLAGAPLDGKLDGVNLMPFLAGDANSGPIHEALFWRSTSSKRTDIGIRCGDLKYVSNGDSEAIFNVSNDIAEAHPLSGGDATRLKALWEQWNKENRAPRFPGYSSYHLKVNAYYQKMMDEMSGDRD